MRASWERFLQHFNNKCIIKNIKQDHIETLNLNQYHL